MAPAQGMASLGPLGPAPGARSGGEQDHRGAAGDLPLHALPEPEHPPLQAWALMPVIRDGLRRVTLDDGELEDYRGEVQPLRCPVSYRSR
jgi:hypothetical protein